MTKKQLMSAGALIGAVLSATAASPVFVYDGAGSLMQSLDNVCRIEVADGTLRFVGAAGGSSDVALDKINYFTFDKDLFSGMTAPGADAAIALEAREGFIVVSASDAILSVSIYDAAGLCVARTAPCSERAAIALDGRGFYIVSVATATDNKTIKLLK